MSAHAPISIVGNSSFTEANGVKNESALGTKDDPFIIENWAISTSGSYGIELRQTTAFVIIRNCVITRSNDDSGKGITSTPHPMFYFKIIPYMDLQMAS